MAATGPALPARYTAPELIAHGGMADVYRVTDEVLGRTVAVKVLAERYARQEEFDARFLREARTAASLTGEPFVVAIHDVGESSEGLPFIVMEYVAGGTVADRLRAGPVEPGQALRWLEQAAAGLDAAHARGIVHRDVKPANLLVASDGSIRVSDFGIARAAGHDTLTAAGTILGSSGYMAPEQARGEPSTPATDRYGLACVAFELLTGSRPFERDNATAEAAAHSTEPPPRATSFDDRLPLPVDLVFARGLAKVPAERPASCGELVSDLRMALGATTRAAPSPSFNPPTRVFRRSPSRVPAVVLGALALLGAGGVLAWALTESDAGSQAATVVRTETLRGETVELTVTTGGETVERTVTAEAETVVVTQTTETTNGGTTEPAPTTESVETTAPPPPPTGESGRSLNDRAFALLQQGDVASALPLLESAVAVLRGSSTITEAYASYNLAWARFASGRCDGVLELLDRSQAVQGERREIDRLRRQAERRCSGDDD